MEAYNYYIYKLQWKTSDCLHYDAVLLIIVFLFFNGLRYDTLLICYYVCVSAVYVMIQYGLLLWLSQFNYVLTNMCSVENSPICDSGRLCSPFGIAAAYCFPVTISGHQKVSWHKIIWNYVIDYNWLRLSHACFWSEVRLVGDSRIELSTGLLSPHDWSSLICSPFVSGDIWRNFLL